MLYLGSNWWFSRIQVISLSGVIYKNGPYEAVEYNLTVK